MRSFGCIKSNLIGNEPLIQQSNRVTFPSKYILSDLPPIIDQGNDPICVSATLMDIVKYHLTLHNTKTKLKSNYFYKLDREASDDGMMPKSALDILVESDHDDLRKFSLYARINSILVMKNCIMSNGPIMVCLPAKSFNNDFWIGPSLLGGHAVSFVGWKDDYFILKNSWGTEYGDNGYYYFPVNMCNLIYESWTLII